MSLYHEIPKESIMTILQDRFSREELDVVRLELPDLLLSCTSMMDLQGKVSDLLKSKREPEEFRKIHGPDFSSSRG